MPSSQQKETTPLFRFNIYMCVRVCLFPSVSQENSGIRNIIFYFPSSHVFRHTHCLFPSVSHTHGYGDVWTAMIEWPGVHISLYLHIRTQTQEMKSAGIEPAIAAIESAKIYAL